MVSSPTDSIRNGSIPSEFLCSLTRELMKEPVLSRYGHHFERAAILEHLEKNDMVCPVTRECLRPSHLISDKSMQMKIRVWAKQAAVNELNEAVKQADRLRQCHDADAADRDNEVDVVGHCTFPPARFLCPLTRQLMTDPVLAETGVTYERNAVLRYLRKDQEHKCPVTGKSLLPSNIVSDVGLHYEIQQWRVQNEPRAIVPTCDDARSRDEELDNLSWGDFSVSDIMNGNDHSDETAASGPIGTPAVDRLPPSFDDDNIVRNKTPEKAATGPTKDYGGIAIKRETVSIPSIASPNSPRQMTADRVKTKRELADVLDNVMGILTV